MREGAGLLQTDEAHAGPFLTLLAAGRQQPKALTISQNYCGRSVHSKKGPKSVFAGLSLRSRFTFRVLIHNGSSSWFRTSMDFLKSAVASISKGPAFPYTFGDRVDIDQSIWTLHNGTRRVCRESTSYA
jgi:hypothetical protein